MELYHFSSTGLVAQQARLTDSSVRVAALAASWTPAPITRSAIVQSPQSESVTLTLPFRPDYLGIDLRGQVSVQIYECTDEQVTHDTVTADAVPIYRGEVASVQYEDGLIQIELAGQRRRLGTLIATPSYNRLCRWALYSEGCGVTRTPQTGQIAAILAPNEFTSGLFATMPDPQYYAGGIIEIGDRVWPVVEMLTVSAGVRILGSLPDSVQPGDSFRASAGCDKRPQTCLQRFSNLDNFGGFTGIPGAGGRYDRS